MKRLAKSCRCDCLSSIVADDYLTSSNCSVAAMTGKTTPCTIFWPKDYLTVYICVASGWHKKKSCVQSA